MNKFFTAIAKNDMESISQLLREGFDPNAKDADGRTALMHAVLNGKDELIKLLISNGADVQAQDLQGNSALHFASQNYRVSAATLLLEAGAIVDVRDEYGNTPLGRAVFNSQGRGEIIDLFLKNGADRYAKNNNGKTPFDLAHLIANYDVKQFFG